ncbi:nucleotide exchange factor GrpE [Desulfobacula toluolica]|uniref:Protein GrpE n=1 Tax=Desulfobacula toluolica (strain DSM 7467 / Tol2) TaxID=651182 RepID=K0N335_DESTT|nr:nucleotide exchange factor GrpE [Desulfobacula toluolica]CCK78519.1 GrpE: HSP70 cofactor [Desulfobacula toluolica Tol2]
MANEKKKKIETENEDSPKNEAEKAKTKDDSDKPAKKDTSEKEGINELKEQLLFEKDRVLRLSAEFENYKKRKQRELDEFKKFANETVFRQFLTVVDNLERAILSAEEVSEDDGLLEGVKLTYKDIIKLFETFNVKPVEAENKPFDPNFHQAVNQESTDEVPENTVITVLQKGYLLHDRLIRPAMVVVSKKTEKKTEKTKEN